MAALSGVEISQRKCILHLSSQDSKVLPFSEKSWRKFLSCAKRWNEIEGTVECEIVTKARACLGLKLGDRHVDTEKEDIVDDDEQLSEDLSQIYGYHCECYKRFCDITQISRAEKRNEKKRKHQDHDEVEHGKHGTEPPRRKLRSTSDFLPGNPQKPHVLARVCIICNKRDRWSRDKKSRKTVRDKYSQCQTLTAGQLLEAARRKKDERLLMQIEEKDLVALEVCYHRLCYNEYTRFVTKTGPSDEAPMFKDAYTKFCEEVIQKRIIQNNEILFLTSLRRKFVKCVQEVEEVDCTNYRSHNLKKQLKKTFPTLVIQRSYAKNTSDLVNSQSLAAKELVETVVGSDTSCTDTDTDSSEAAVDADLFPHDSANLHTQLAKKIFFL